MKRKKFIKKIASEQIELLFQQAKQIFKDDPAKSQRYVDIARAISKKCKVRIPRAHKFQICRHCKSYLVPGVNCRIRLRSNRGRHVTLTCFNCKRHTRYYY
ncbi:MAG: ribonuclease P protein component 4 [Candidatus Helarchaeota archaeon]